MAAVTVIVPFPVPEVCESVNQGALSLAVQVRVPPPVLLMFSVWAAGLPPPCCAVKDRVVGLAPMLGGTGAAITVKVTGTEVLLAPGALMVIVPLYVPTANEPVAALTLIAPLLIPEAGESVIQAALSLAAQVRVPPPVLLMFSVLGSRVAVSSLDCEGEAGWACTNCRGHGCRCYRQVDRNGESWTTYSIHRDYRIVGSGGERAGGGSQCNRTIAGAGGWAQR